jgi:hypothetical protein
MFFLDSNSSEQFDRLSTPAPSKKSLFARNIEMQINGWKDSLSSEFSGMSGSSEKRFW